METFGNRTVCAYLDTVGVKRDADRLMGSQLPCHVVEGPDMI